MFIKPLIPFRLRRKVYFARRAVEPFLYEQAHRARIKRVELRPVNRSPRIIVSLTSIPSRLPKLHLVIKSILRQTVQPDKIILWLSTEHTREGIGALSASDIPSNLSSLQSRGLEICWTEDIGSFRKLLPTLQRFPEDIIITIDDDASYERKLIECLYSAYLREGGKPKHIYCGKSRVIERHEEEDRTVYYGAERRKRSSDTKDLARFFVGTGGVLYPPGVFDEEAFKREVFLKMVPYEDDIWFNVMAMRRGVRVSQVNVGVASPLPTHSYNSLMSITGKHKSRHQFNRQLTELMQYYGLKL